MNKRQKIVQQQFIGNEEAVIKRLKSVYTQSNKDITGKLASLDTSISALQKALEDVTEDEIGNLAAAFLNSKKHYTPEEAKETLQSMLRSKVYQKNYQKALKKQVGDVLDKMHDTEFKTVSDYLQTCYEDGFIGTLYDLQGQGIPLCFPMDQEAMVRAVQLDSKISQGLYSRLGEDVSLLKKKITAQVSRGISTGMSWQQVAQQLAGYTNIGFNNAVRIARTEGHRIQCQSGMDACYKAKEKGADVVKQWDAALDARTRDSHSRVDGEIRELDEKFSNGLMFPGDPSGGAAEVINCRCALLQRARWALEGSFTKMNNFTKQLETFESPEAYGEFKKAFFSDGNKRYMNYVEDLQNKYKTRELSTLLERMTELEYKHYSNLLKKNPLFNKQDLKNQENADTITMKVLSRPTKSGEEHYKKLLDSLEQLESKGCTYNPVIDHTKALSEDEIIKALAGGDRTSGSCASVGLAYVGQKQGWNILDFRDGESRRFFSSSFNLHTLALADGLKVHRAEGACSLTVGNRLLKLCETGKEYYLCTGRHAAIVRKNDDGVLQYLELQSATRSGWTKFDGNPRYTLKTRFGCTQTSSPAQYYDFMIDLNDSDFETDDFRSLLGYINTAENEQRKGSSGTIK